MAKKCEACGAKLGLLGGKAIQLYDETVCEKCLTSWGFTVGDLENEKYKYKSWRFLSRGKSECDKMIAEAEYKKEHTNTKRFKVFGDGTNEKGEDIQKLLARLPKEEIDKDDLYGGYSSNKTLKEDGELDHEYYIYAGETLDCDLVVSGDTVKVYMLDHHIGDLPELKPILDSCKEYAADIMVLGGKYKMLTGDEFEGYEIETGEDEYYAIVQVDWVE